MRIAFFMRGIPGDICSPHISNMMEQLFTALRGAGSEVDLLVAESKVWDLARIEPEYDIYVLKSTSSLSLSLASILSEKGAIIVNSVEGCQLSRDKIAAEVALAANRIPVPAAWTTGQGRLLRPLLTEGALWLKARAGSNGQGVFRLTDKAAGSFEQNPTDSYGLPQPLFAQRDVMSSGRDLKIYVIGEQQWAITRPWPAVTALDKQGQPADLDKDLCATAMACGRALSLEIFGVDFLVAGTKRHVIDINAFPGFKGIDQAPDAIARYLLARVNGKTQGGC